ncbi:unnamed protein product, partial [marine sediment metagenome]
IADLLLLSKKDNPTYHLACMLYNGKTLDERLRVGG